MSMKRLAMPVLVLLFLAFPFLIYSAEDQGSTGPADPAIQEFIRFVNAKRRSIGCPELIWDGRVARVALNHSADMVSRNFFDHTNPDGKNPFERLEESKLDFSGAAENIALGPKTGREAFDTWMGSSGHRKNMLDTRFTRHGVGRVRDRWTHVLIKPKVVPQPDRGRYTAPDTRTDDSAVRP
jgi:uncharacterized protein YkwD